MFLDDELLGICEKAQLSNPDNIQELNKTLCEKCEDYYKSKINPMQMSPKDVKVILDRTFILFDSFVRMALKSENDRIKILGKLFEQFTFKQQFLSNEKMKGIYTKL